MTSHSNVRDNHLFRRSSFRTTISHLAKHEECTEKDSSASDELVDATDEEGKPRRSTRRTTGEISFFGRTEGTKKLGRDCLVPSEERHVRLISYRYNRLDNKKRQPYLNKYN